MLLMISVAMAVIASFIFVARKDPGFISSSSWQHLGRPAARRTAVVRTPLALAGGERRP
jgi:hypothetical protein